MYILMSFPQNYKKASHAFSHSADIVLFCCHEMRGVHTLSLTTSQCCDVAFTSIRHARMRPICLHVTSLTSSMYVI